MQRPKAVLKFASVVALAMSVFPALTFAQHYNETDLVSDVAGLAKVRDGNLVNPWGLARSPGSPWWVGNNGTGTSTLYNGEGTPFPPGTPLVVNIPTTKNALPGTTGTPTGVVSNGSSDFAIAPGLPAVFIFVTEDGTISGWNPKVDFLNAIKEVDRGDKAVYKGATLGEHAGKRYLYVANFRSGQIEVYDTNFKRVHAFDDAFAEDDHDRDRDRDGDERHSRRGFAPFNIQNVGGNLIVAYAEQDSEKKGRSARRGPGLRKYFQLRRKIPRATSERRLVQCTVGHRACAGRFRRI
jgi:TIGR03118 family protein